MPYDYAPQEQCPLVCISCYFLFGLGGGSHWQQFPLANKATTYNCLSYNQIGGRVTKQSARDDHRERGERENDNDN